MPEMCGLWSVDHPSGAARASPTQLTQWAHSLCSVWVSCAPALGEFTRLFHVFEKYQVSAMKDTVILSPEY